MSIFIETPTELLPTLAEVRALEPVFHNQHFGQNAHEFARRMAPDYWEVGASGRRYSREFILANADAIAAANADAAGWSMSEHALRELGPETYLHTYTLDQAGRLTRRATIWRRSEGWWQILYHHGCVINSNKDNTL